jgi:hypothetical protein
MSSDENIWTQEGRVAEIREKCRMSKFTICILHKTLLRLSSQKGDIVGHIARMGEVNNAHWILIGRPKLDRVFQKAWRMPEQIS